MSSAVHSVEEKRRKRRKDDERERNNFSSHRSRTACQCDLKASITVLCRSWIWMVEKLVCVYVEFNDDASATNPNSLKSDTGRDGELESDSFFFLRSFFSAQHLTGQHRQQKPSCVWITSRKRRLKFHFTLSCGRRWRLITVHLLIRIEQCRLHKNGIKCRLCELRTLTATSRRWRWSAAAESTIYHRMRIGQVIGSNAVEWVGECIAWEIF